jgi:signal transduction histidine kinase
MHRARRIPFFVFARFALLLTASAAGLRAAETAARDSAPAVAATTAANPRLTGTPLLRVWRAEDYGAALLNTRILVHPSGLVYVCNEDGVLEFDGERWRTLTLPRGGAGRSLALDAAGRLWVFGHDDVALFEPDARGDLHAVSKLELLPPEARATGTINRVAVTTDGIYARGQRRLMLFKRDGTVQTWAGAGLNGLVWTLGDTLYADLDRLVRVSPAGIEPVSLGPAAPARASEELRVFATQAAGDRPGEWLLLTVRGPMRWGGPGTPLRPLTATSSEPFTADLASAGAFLADGRLALGTERSGLFIFERDGRLAQRLDRTHGLPGNRINDLALDAEGGLWLAMQEGIARLDLESPFAVHGSPQGLVASPRRFAAWRNHLYLSTSEGIARRDVVTGRFLTVDGFQVGTNRPLVVDDRLVASTRGLREVTADDESRAWTAELIGPIAAAVRSPGWIFAGSSTGLSFLRPTADRKGWENAGRVSTLALGLDEVLDRGDGWLWAVTRNGEIARVDLRGGPKLDAAAKVFTPVEGVPDADRNDRVQLLTVGDDLLAVGLGWMRRFEPKSDRFVPETRLALGGVTARGARLVGRSATGGLWLRPVETPGRILRGEPAADATWRVSELPLTPFRGVVFDSVFEEASTRTLWLAGQGVLASLDLAWRPSRPAPPPRVSIRRVDDASGTLLAAGGALATRLELPPEQRTVRVTYAAPIFSADYRGRAQTLYRTRLDGLDEDWSPWSAETHRDFTNLPFHPLRFRVQSRTAERPELAEATFALIVNAPWWLTPWAFLGYLALAGGVVYGGVRARTRALQRRNAQLEALVAARTLQLERLNQELTDAVSIVAHDLRGPVSGIRSLARQLRATPHLWTSAEGPEFLGEIERTSGAAVDMMAGLLDLQRASDRAAGPTLAPVDLGALVDEVCSQLVPAAAAKRIALRVAAASLTRVTDAESIASVAANLVSNAIKFLPADGRGVIDVTLTADATTCRLVVADNGPGIPAGERPAVFEKFAKGTARPTAGEASTGLGLFIVRKLVTALGGQVEAGDTPGGGATFTVVWPAGSVANVSG